MPAPGRSTCRRRFAASTRNTGLEATCRRSRRRAACRGRGPCREESRDRAGNDRALDRRRAAGGHLRDRAHERLRRYRRGVSARRRPADPRTEARFALGVGMRLRRIAAERIRPKAHRRRRRAARGRSRATRSTTWKASRSAARTGRRDDDHAGLGQQPEHAPAHAAPVVRACRGAGRRPLIGRNSHRKRKAAPEGAALWKWREEGWPTGLPERPRRASRFAASAGGRERQSLSRASSRNSSRPPRCSTERSACEVIRSRTLWPRAVAEQRHLVEVRQKAPPRLVVRVADIVAGENRLTGQFTASSHGKILLSARRISPVSAGNARAVWKSGFAIVTLPAGVKDTRPTNPGCHDVQDDPGDCRIG